MDALIKFESKVDIQLSAKTNDNARCRLLKKNKKKKQRYIYI